MRPTCDATRGVRRVRAAVTADTATFAAWIARACPLPGGLAEALPALLERLLAEETLRATVVEDLNAAASQPSVVAFGISAFLRESFAAQFLAAPFPHLETEILNRAWRGQRPCPLLRSEEAARANAGDGLTLCPLLWLQRANDPADPETRALLTIAQQAFVTAHRGYRLQRLVKETLGIHAEAHVAGGFREWCRLSPGTALPFSGRRLEQERVVLAVTRREAEASTLPGQLVAYLFDYRPPRCGFTRAEQQVLLRAAEGMTDAEIARQLDISTAAVALRWRSVYARVADRVPSALQPASTSPGRGRGHEKRRRVIAFLNDHPEELRPYLPS